VVYVLGLVAALLLAIGFVVQQQVAESEPVELSLRPRLLIDLAKRPVWLGGIGAMVAGQLCGAMALGVGDVALVEPLLACNVLFALPLSALRHGRRARAVDLLAAAVLVGGLAGFVLAGQPHGGGAAKVRPLIWVIALGAGALAAATTVALALRVRLPGRATLFAGAAGVLFGYQDTLTRPTVERLSDGVLRLLTDWPPYLIVASAILGLLLAQSAFEAAPLAASLPAITAAEPVTGIALGVWLYQEQLRGGLLHSSIELASLVAIVASIVVLTRSPAVAGVTAASPSAAPDHSC
jgi:hypothetical protein